MLMYVHVKGLSLKFELSNVSIRRQPRSNQGSERHFLLQSQPKALLHVQLRHAMRKFPVKGVDESAENVVNEDDAHSGAGADPAAGAEGDELEVVAARVDLGVLAGHEAVGVEVQRVVPHLRVSAYGPYVDAQPRALGDVVPVHLAGFPGHSRQVQRRRRVLPVCLLADGLQHISITGPNIKHLWIW